VRELSGAELLLHRSDAMMVFEGLWRYPTMDELITMHGGPATGASVVDYLMRPGFEPGVPDGALGDEQRIELGARVVRVLHTPGHTPGHCCFEFAFKVIWTPGHSAGHICLYDKRNKVLLSGDHVLPHITPSVGLHVRTTSNPLADYLDSLKRIGERGYRFAMPAHGEPFLDPSSRVARIVRHHEFRLRACVDALGRETLTGWDVTPRVFGEDLRGFHRYAAMFETLAHLVLAESRGQVERVADDGVIHWRRR
jgi:glyoxylase-like metal-dependent hydrolase (beta-lactamase superfamily II)